MKSIWAIILLITLLIYEKLWRPKVCIRKIRSRITYLGGNICVIEKLTPRDEIFSVYYTINGVSKRSNVKFNIFYRAKWD